MELEVYWTQFAQDKLTDIFEYYKFNEGIAFARNLSNGIVEESLKLEKNPFIGQREDLLRERIQEFRYLLFKNYKLIYYVDELNKMIFISHIFDTRQNPIKIEKF